jgi:hypothetical protein
MDVTTGPLGRIRLGGALLTSETTPAELSYG